MFMKPSLTNFRQTNIKNTPLSHEPKPFTTLYVTFEEEISDSIEKSIQNNNAIPLPMHPLNNSTSSHSDQSQSVPKVMEIELVDFEFRPKRIKIPTNSIVRWKIGDNKSSHQSNIYSGGRDFVIYIRELDIESELLTKGQSFEHLFTEAGEYNIECSNYSRIKGTIEVLAGNQEIAGELKKRGLMKNQKEVDDYLSRQNASNTLSQIEDRAMKEKLPTVGDLYYQELLEEYNSRMFSNSEEDERLERDKATFVFPPSASNKTDLENKDDSNDITTDNSSLFSERDKTTEFDMRNRVPPIEDFLEHINKQEAKTASFPLKFVTHAEEQKFAEPSKEINDNDEDEDEKHIDNNNICESIVLRNSDHQSENRIVTSVIKGKDECLTKEAQGIESQNQGTLNEKENEMNKENIVKNKKKTKNKKNRKKNAKNEEPSKVENTVVTEKIPEPVQPPVQISEEKLKTAELKASLIKKLKSNKNEAKLNKEALEKEKINSMKKIEENEKQSKLNENKEVFVAQANTEKNSKPATSEKKAKNKKGKKKNKNPGKENDMKTANTEVLEKVELKEENKEKSFFDFIKKATQERVTQIKHNLRVDKTIKSANNAEEDEEEQGKIAMLKAFLSNRFEYAEAFDLS